MNYDFSKCNNLRWEHKNDNGICHIFPDSDGDRLCFTQRVTDFNGLAQTYIRASYILNDTFYDKIEGKGDFIKDVKILPRDPRTYTDWQVGDKVNILDNELATIVEVGARINNIVICFNSRGYWGTYTCDELFNMGELVLTDYERTLIQVPKYVFNQGDKVLCRFDKHSEDENDKIWCYGKYYGANDDDRYLYSVTMDSGITYNYCECIPYNENTWHLLGTKEDYND